MLYIITCVSDEYCQYLTELRQNIKTMVQVPYKLVIAGNTTTQIECEDADSEIVINYKHNKGIFAAKYSAFEYLYRRGLDNGDYITFIDADDYYQTTITKDLLPERSPIIYYDAFARNIEDVRDCRKMFTWCFAFAPEILAKAYNTINDAIKEYGLIDLHDVYINSCEDMLLFAPLLREGVTCVPIDTICHTENDTSATNSTTYTYDKVCNLFGEWSRLLTIASKLTYGRQWLISTMNNCFGQYWHNYRQWIPFSERELCDEYIRQLQAL